MAANSDYLETLTTYAAILEKWIADTDDKGQYPENKEGLKLMLGIWGDHAVNPEYEELRTEFPELAGSQFYLK